MEIWILLDFFLRVGVHALFLIIASAPAAVAYPKKIVEAIIVYPHVFEDREDTSEKVLVIQDGYFVTLRKASVLAETVLLQDFRDEGIVETYVDGNHYERHLYQDTQGQASLLVKPQENGHYDVKGVLNFTHRIEPLVNIERSSSAPRAHKIFKIPFKGGTHSIAKLYDDGADSTRSATRIEKRAYPKDFTIEAFFMSDYEHTKYFGNRTEERIEYAAVIMHSVSLRTQQLDIPGFVALTGIAGSFTNNESYVKLLAPDKLIGNETLLLLSRYMWANYTMRRADILYMVTGRDMVDITSTGFRSGVLGMTYRRKACSRYQVAAGEDIPGMLSGIHTAAHEIGHLLGSDHDGYGTSSSCSAKDGYLMSPSSGGRHSFFFSNCSKKDISSFVGTFDAYCLEYNRNRHVAVFPNATTRLPGAIITGTEYCRRYFAGKKNVTYTKWDSDLAKCKFRCKIGVKKNGDPEYAIRFAFDGTPCNRSKPQMVCKNTICI